MTLGEHIQTLRKNAGYSQEALGEALGVTRQSISKWESDQAMPEVEKLIALSRLFGVPVGVLLQVEEPSPGGETLTERELQAVDAIVTRYVEETKLLQNTAPPPEPLKKRKKWPYVLAAGALVLVLSGVWVSTAGRMRSLEHQITDLQFQLNSLDINVSNQIGSITSQVSEILERQNSVTAAYTCAQAHVDYRAGTAIAALSATSRSSQAGMTAVFSASSPDFDTVLMEGTLNADGAFTADLICPLSDEIAFSVAFTAGGVTQNQALDTWYNLLSDSRPWVDLFAFLALESVVDGQYLWNEPLEFSTGTADAGGETVSVASLVLTVYQDGDAVWRSAPLSPVGDDSIQVPMDLTLTGLEEGSQLLVAGTVTDSLNRTWRVLLDGYQVEAAGDGGLEFMPLDSYPDADNLP